MEDPPPSWHEIHELTRRLDSGAPRERKAAAEALAACGTPAVEPLCRALGDEDDEVRTAIAESLAKLGRAAVRSLAWRLQSGTSRVSWNAAWALGFCGPAALEPLERALGSRDQKLRWKVVKALQQLALPECTPILCRMLEEHEAEIRLAVVSALAEIGDVRAIRPLCRAMRNGFVGGAVGTQLVWGGLVFGLGASLFSAALYFTLSVQIAAISTVILIVQAFLNYFETRRKKGEFSRAVTEALVRIGERRPSLELRNVLPDLRLLAADRLQQDPATREASRAAARRIHELTDPLINLPLPAEPSTGPDTLPRPATVPPSKEQSLPRV